MRLLGITTVSTAQAKAAAVAAHSRRPKWSGRDSGSILCRFLAMYDQSSAGIQCGKLIWRYKIGPDTKSPSPQASIYRARWQNSPQITINIFAMTIPLVIGA